MKKAEELLNKKMVVLNMGLKNFKESLDTQGVKCIHLNWKPPAGGKKEIIKILDRINSSKILLNRIKKANKKVAQIMMNAQPYLVDVRPAIEVIPRMTKNTILHAGPPVTWDKMCGPMRGAVLGALIFEGKAKNLKEAERLVKSGKIKFSPCHHHNAVGPMAGIISPSMYVFCVKNKKYGNVAYCSLNEGLGRALRFGAWGKDVLKRLIWMRDVLGPVLSKAVKKMGGIDIKTIIAQGLQRGDECHNRNMASTDLFLKLITPALISLDEERKTILDVINFIGDNPHFFLNLSMASCKATVDPAKGVPYSTVMWVMARNGTEIGIRISSLGDRWFTAPAGMPKGLYFPGFSEKDANPDIGDSTISESAGIGAYAMAAAPAIVGFVGGKAQDAINYTLEMYEITTAQHKDFLIPALNFRGTPLGVDVLKVVEKQIAPVINTGIAHKKPGIGQVGAGILRGDLKLFEDALIAFAKKYKIL